MQLTTYCTINTILYFVFFFNFKLLSNKKKFHNISVLYAIEYILYNKRNFFVFCFFSNYYKIYRLIFHDWRFKCPLFAIIKKECIGLKYNALA